MKTLSVSAEPDFPLSAYGSEKVTAPQGDLCQEKYKFPDTFPNRKKSSQNRLQALFTSETQSQIPKI